MHRNSLISLSYISFIGILASTLIVSNTKSFSAIAQSSYCGTNFVSQTYEQQGYDGTLYHSYLDFRRGWETINPAACGREYWISPNPRHPNYGVRFVYLVDGEQQRVVQTLYYEAADGSIHPFENASEARLPNPFDSDLGLSSGTRIGSQGSSEPDRTNNHNSQAPSFQETTPFFQKPFDGNFQMWNPFDHHFPLQFESYDGVVVNFRGERLPSGIGVYDGHEGYDWQMPIGTPIVAVADGMVSFAGRTDSFYCPVLERQVNDLIVTISHTTSDGRQIESQYQHLSNVYVQDGQTVRAGQQIGLSGSTGCSTGPHLHFGVYSLTNTNDGQRSPIDPYGWQGSYSDPWASHPSGAASTWLWIQGQAPNL